MIVEQLEQWIGTEVVDADGASVGKLTEVYFRGGEPVLITTKGGLLSRKRQIAPLDGASVSRNHVRIAYGADRLVESNSPGDSLDATDLAAVSEHYGAGHELSEDEIEGSAVRAERLRLAAEAQAHAAALEAEADQRATDAETAAARANAAQRNAKTAAELKEQAELDAIEARRAATEL